MNKWRKYDKRNNFKKAILFYIITINFEKTVFIIFIYYYINNNIIL